MWSNPRCDHKNKQGQMRCRSESSRPQFTMPLKEVKNKKDRQPKFYCNRHSSLYPAVSGLTGEPREEYFFAATS